jgi:lipopolysaccharide biosynthesis glycosyltransferase
MQQWCKERGSYLVVTDKQSPLIEKIAPSSPLIPLWEKKYGIDLWQYRKAWFKKPTACLLSPYEQTVWIDLDCEVKGPLDSIFSLAIPPYGIACSSELLQGKWAGVNTGVILFSKDSFIIKQWVEESLSSNHLYAGDQDVLSALIEQNPLCFLELPNRYNHSRFHQTHEDALIIHWHGNVGKQIIASSMNQ